MCVCVCVQQLAELSHQTAGMTNTAMNNEPDGAANGNHSTSWSTNEQQTPPKREEEWTQRLVRSLSVLVKMAANAECLPLILPSLSEHVGVFVRALQDTSHLPCHSMMSSFLHNLLKVLPVYHRQLCFIVVQYICTPFLGCI